MHQPTLKEITASEATIIWGVVILCKHSEDQLVSPVISSVDGKLILISAASAEDTLEKVVTIAEE